MADFSPKLEKCSFVRASVPWRYAAGLAAFLQPGSAESITDGWLQLPDRRESWKFPAEAMDDRNPCPDRGGGRYAADPGGGGAYYRISGVSAPSEADPFAYLLGRRAKSCQAELEAKLEAGAGHSWPVFFDRAVVYCMGAGSDTADQLCCTGVVEETVDCDIPGIRIVFFSSRSDSAFVCCFRLYD